MQVSIPLRKIKRANQSENVKNPSQKYMEIVTVDNFEFWFMGFLNYQKAFSYLQQALHEAQNLVEKWFKVSSPQLLQMYLHEPDKDLYSQRLCTNFLLRRNWPPIFQPYFLFSAWNKFFQSDYCFSTIIAMLSHKPQLFMLCLLYYMMYDTFHCFLSNVFWCSMKT